MDSAFFVRVAIGSFLCFAVNCFDSSLWKVHALTSVNLPRTRALKLVFVKEKEKKSSRVDLLYLKLLRTVNSHKILNSTVYLSSFLNRLHQHSIFFSLKTNWSHSISTSSSLTFTPALMSSLTSRQRGLQMFSHRQGSKIVTQIDTMQSRVLRLSLSSICINLTFSNLPLQISCQLKTCWFGCLQRACTKTVEPIMGHLGCISH